MRTRGRRRGGRALCDREGSVRFAARRGECTLCGLLVLAPLQGAWTQPGAPCVRRFRLFVRGSVPFCNLTYTLTLFTAVGRGRPGCEYLGNLRARNKTPRQKISLWSKDLRNMSLTLGKTLWPPQKLRTFGFRAPHRGPVGSGATRVSLKGRVSPLLQPSLFNIVESPIWDIKNPFGTQKATPTDFTERDKRGSVSRNTGLVSQNLNFSVMGDVHVRTLARRIACRGPRWPFSRT